MWHFVGATESKSDWELESRRRTDRARERLGVRVEGGGGAMREREG